MLLITFILARNVPISSGSSSRICLTHPKISNYLFLDGSYSTLMGQTNSELLPEDIGTFLAKIKVISSISGHSSTFSEVFYFLVKPPFKHYSPIARPMKASDFPIFCPWSQTSKRTSLLWLVISLRHSCL
jgi:hypothetical protein